MSVEQGHTKSARFCKCIDEIESTQMSKIESVYSRMLYVSSLSSILIISSESKRKSNLQQTPKQPQLRDTSGKI